MYNFNEGNIEVLNIKAYAANNALIHILSLSILVLFPLPSAVKF